MYKQVVMHQHRYGESVYVVESETILEETNQNHLDTLIKELDIDFEEDLVEHITIHLVDKVDAIITIGETV